MSNTFDSTTHKASGPVTKGPARIGIRELIRRAVGEDLLRDAIDADFVLRIGERYQVPWTEMSADHFACDQADLYPIVLGVWLLVWDGGESFEAVWNKTRLEELLDGVLGPEF